MSNSPQLRSMVDTSLPQLAWVTSIDLPTLTVEVRHGISVEFGSNFIVEGVWDASFNEANFHLSDNFFGSGIRLTENEIWIVPSRALVDRIIYCTIGRNLFASNSLPLLLGVTGADLLDDHDYRAQTSALRRGIFSYDSRFPIRHPQISYFYQLLHRPLIAGAHVRHGEPAVKVRIASFQDYEQKLRTVIEQLRANAECVRRRNPTACFSTISSGYDSTAVTTIARDVRFDRCFTARRSSLNVLPLISQRFSVDDGSPIAKHLELTLSYFKKPDRHVDRTEILWYVPCAEGAQVLFHSMVSELGQTDEVAMLFTGFHGDKVWDIATAAPYDSDEIRRGDVSGLDLSEIRLQCGFINVAVPFIFARSIADLVSISRSEEMKPWRTFNGYDRPIPRRIVERAGVPRNIFGREKRAAVQRPPFPYNRILRKEFLTHIHEKHGISPRTSLSRRFWTNVGLRFGPYFSRLGSKRTNKLASAHPGQSICPTNSICGLYLR
jgi:hypothetical protein